AVSAAAATHFAFNAPSNATEGNGFLFGLTAQDQFNNTDTNYGGTVHFTSSDGAATLPANSTLMLGNGFFNATLETEGNQTITATDTVASSITGTSNTIFVADAALLPGSLTPPLAFEGVAISNQTVFSFTDTNPSASASDFTVTVNTGDATLDS